MKILKKVLIISCCILLGLGIIYLGVSFYFTNRFLPGTTINHVESTGKTAAEVEEDLKASVENYVLRMIERNGIIEERTSADFGLTYEGTEGVKELLDKNNPFLWIVSLFNKTEEHVDVQVSYNKNAFVKTVSGLECMKEENQEKCQSAYLVYKDGTYEIVKEVYGKEIDTDAMYEVIRSAIETMTLSVDMEESGCYVMPAITSESPELLAAQVQLNKYIATNITYEIDSEEKTVDHETIHQWLVSDDIMNVRISEEKVREFAESLAADYNTENSSQVMTTPLGKEVSIENARKGRKVDTEAEFIQIMEDVKAGNTVKRELIWAEEGTPLNEFGWGTSYVEVDMGEQHMWFIKNGKIIFECDVVTGKPSTPTPTGMYRVIEKMRDKVLRGEKKPDGTYGYESPVSYWMRLTWSGIGLHDATWQAKFGGERYKNGYGSHGCINMPLSKAKELYNMIEIGDRVVIHK